MSADLSRYITDEVVEAVHQGYLNAPSVPQVLHVALPMILPQHTGDVLAELASSLEGHTFRQYRDMRPPRCECGAEKLSRAYATMRHPEGSA